MAWFVMVAQSERDDGAGGAAGVVAAGSGDAGVPSIGQPMWAADHERLLTYREFCELLQDAGQRVWLDRLIQFHLDTARGGQRDRAERLINAIGQLSRFLDICVGSR